MLDIDPLIRLVHTAVHHEHLVGASVQLLGYGSADELRAAEDHDTHEATMPRRLDQPPLAFELPVRGPSSKCR
jgi:hypothetical protein